MTDWIKTHEDVLIAACACPWGPGVDCPLGPMFDNDAAHVTAHALAAERAARDKAEAERDRALVAGAVAVHAAREALLKFSLHVGCRIKGSAHYTAMWATSACTCGLDAALQALDGGGER